MSLREILYKALMTYFVIATCITAAILILGMSFDSDAVLTYEAFASPLIFAALGIIPNFIMYSSKELSNKQILLRKLIQFLIIEAEVLTVGFASPEIHTENFSVTAGMFVSVMIIFIFTNVITMLNSCFIARQMTNDLKIFQQNSE